MEAYKVLSKQATRQKYDHDISDAPYRTHYAYNRRERSSNSDYENWKQQMNNMNTRQG